MQSLLANASTGSLPFAPPILRAGNLLISQTANILQFLAPRLKLVPPSEAARIWAHQLQLTIMDLVTEAHDTHHPIAGTLYYHQQKSEARRRAHHFIQTRIPKFLGYFENILSAKARHRNHLVGSQLSYADLSMYQVIAGLSYAFPRTMGRLQSAHPNLVRLTATVIEHPRVAAYLDSKRRIPFNENGIFRRYPELEA
jgi:glutathione S-transferase